MTEKVLAEIVYEAIQRWSLLDVTVIHRVGVLRLQEPIVLVSVSSASAGPGTVMSSPTELVIAATKALQSERKSAGQSRAA